MAAHQLVREYVTKWIRDHIRQAGRGAQAELQRKLAVDKGQMSRIKNGSCLASDGVVSAWRKLHHVTEDN